MIFGMTVVTYIPRLLPFVALDTDRFPKRLVRILKNIPYAVLGALIFPGILTADPNPWFGVVGGLAAVAFSLANAHLIIVVLGSVLSLTSLLQLGVF
jgi:branched-subunit amino acid transport protein